MSRWERSALEGCTLADVERWATALNAHLTLGLTVDGERPLTDARHAALQSWFASFLRESGWTVEPEASFNVYGDRGRVDLLAWHAVARIVLVVEVKTRIDDVQDVIGRLDVKRRVAEILARERGWAAVALVPALLILESGTARRRVRAHEALFARYTTRGRRAVAWLRRPVAPAPKGILLLVSLPP